MTTRRPFAACIALAAALALPACGLRDGTDEDVDAVRAALEQEDGGFNSEDEVIDESLFTDIPEIRLASDAIVLPEAPTARRFTLLLVWGHLPRYDEVDPPTFMDWSGTIQATGASLRVERTIAFEGLDRVEPRTSPDKVDFVSRTEPFADGMLLHVQQEADDAVVKFTSPHATFELKLADVAPVLVGHQPTADGANGVTFHAYAQRPGCADGFVFGRYRRLAQAVGRFHLRVVDDSGDPIGRVRGIYGHSKRLNDDVFFGKYVALDGQHRGKLAGQYGDGMIDGLWRTDAPEAGSLHGRYWEGPDGRPARGLMIGHWAEACPSDAQ